MGTAEQIAVVLRPYRPDIVDFTEVPKGDWTARAAAALGITRDNIRYRIRKYGIKVPRD